MALKCNPNMKFKGRAGVASFDYKPIGWEKAYRFVVKRTEIVDKNNQLYLEDANTCITSSSQILREVILR